MDDVTKRPDTVSTCHDGNPLPPFISSFPSGSNSHNPSESWSLACRGAITELSDFAPGKAARRFTT
eukprot:3908330-Amphidinium_carterae.2